MLSTHRAILLSTLKFKDSSLIAKFFSEEKGLLTVMCNGVRKSQKGSKIGLFQPMSLCELVVNQKPGQGMATLKEIRNTPPLVYLTSKAANIPTCFYMSSLVMQFLHEDNEDRDLFTFVWEFVKQVEEEKISITNLPVHFTSHVLKIEGYLPYPDFKVDGTNVQMADEDRLNATLIDFALNKRLSSFAEAEIDGETRKNCLAYLINSASETLQNRRLKDVYEQVKLIYA